MTEPETTKPSPLTRQLNVRLSDELYEAVVRKAAQLQLETGVPISPPDFVRHLITERAAA